MADLDQIIHQPIRLRIVAALHGLEADAKVEFTWLRSRLDLTDGNLGAHLDKLERASYVVIHKQFVGRKPRSTIHLTKAGRRAFEDYREALRDILDR